MGFSKKLLSLRKINGLSQEEIGGRLNVSRQTVSKWELGETTPEMDKLILISELFNISLDELIKGTDNEDIKIKESKKIEVNNKNLFKTKVKLDKSPKNIYDIIFLIVKILGIIFLVDVIVMVIYFISNGFPNN